MTAVPSFSEFYRAVHGREPFPWQSRLAGLVAASGWPSEIGVPTGLGKTSSIDIAVWALAAQAERPAGERTAPTRIWYVVNRRLLVDAGTDHALRLADLLCNASDGPLADVANLLRAIEGGVTGQPLTVSRFRGGVLDARPPHPAQPAIVCATVPMYASRLLFRAYGASNRVWPIDAALAGVDSLVLLDEAHLSGPLRQVIHDLAECDANKAGALRAPRSFEATPGPRSILGAARAYPQLVALTATGERAADRFDLDEADRKHPVVSARLAARKSTTFERLPVSELAQRMAAHVGHLAAGQADAAILVFVNRPATARDVSATTELELRRHSIPADVVVLTGQLRDHDAEVVRRRLLDPDRGLPAGASPQRERPLVVIATQTLEVGADLDADHLVTETAGTRAIVQRFGRLNRLGGRRHSTALVLHPEGRKNDIYGLEAEAVADLLGGLTSPIDFSPANVSAVLGEPVDQPLDLPALLPAHVWEWSKTSVPVQDAAPIELFYEGFSAPESTVSIAWRTDTGQEGTEVYPPVDSREWVDVSIGDAREFVDANDDVLAIDTDGVTLRRITGAELRPGRRLISPCSAGGYSSAGWDPSSTRAVEDLSPVLSGSIPVRDELIEALAGRALDDVEREVVAALCDVEEVPDSVADVEAARVLWQAVEQSVSSASPGAQLLGVDRVGPTAVPWITWTVDRTRTATAFDALDELSITPTAELQDHLDHVGQMARRIATAIGLPEQLVQGVANAGAFHDLGKADRRFQRWLGASVDRPLAKSQMPAGRWRRMQATSGWPQGARHELLSVQLLDAALEGGLVLGEADLVRHLVVAHHGHGRPSVHLATVEGSTHLTHHDCVGDVKLDTQLDPSRFDPNQATRYRALVERFGLWGLAYLETIVRQADHIVSAVTEVQ
jgi:CRISPR-associated endonuclease/helicase Cas3